MKGILREPLLHFLLLGVMLFIAYSLVARPGRNDAPQKIVVSLGQIEHLEAGFARTWQRPPTDAELKSLIDDWVREEIATREAIALGLDKDDSVIRRRLRQKLEFVSDDIAAQTEPTDADLNAYLQAHLAAFQVEPRLTFSQVFLNPEKHGKHLAHDAAQLLVQLRQSGSRADGSELGDPFLLEQQFSRVPASEIAKQFGDVFAAALARLPTGDWQGPIESGYGMHLVLIRERTAGGVPALADVRDQVLREWTNARRLEGNEKFYQHLLKRYTVTIEGPGSQPSRKPVAQSAR